MTTKNDLIDEVQCTSCEEFKHKLSRVRSRLIPGGQMFLCTTCKSAGYEPRGFIIIAYRYGDDDEKGLAQSLVKDRKYLGDEISLAEALT